MEGPNRLYDSDLCLLGGEIEENLRRLAECGADRVELMMDGPAWDGFQARAEELAAAIGRFPAGVSLHSPCWDVNLTSANREIRAASYQTTLDAVRLASRVHASHVVVHPGFCQTSVFDRETAKRRALEAVEKLAGEAGRLGVTILVENVGYHGTALFDEEEFAHVLDGVGGEAGYLLDTGHAALCGWNMPRLVRRLGKRLRAVHLHDNDGRSDAHLPIGKGCIAWDPLLEAFGELGGLALVLEYNIGTPAEEMEHTKQFLKGRKLI